MGSAHRSELCVRQTHFCFQHNIGSRVDQPGWKVRNGRIPFVFTARTAATLSLHSPFYSAPLFLCRSQLLGRVTLPVAASSSVGTGDGGCEVPCGRFPHARSHQTSRTFTEKRVTHAEIDAICSSFAPAP